MSKKSVVYKFDTVLFSIAMALSAIGVLFIYSTQVANASYSSFYIKQLLYIAVGTFLYVFISRFDYHRYFNYSLVLFFLGLGLLFSVLIFGQKINGARSWINLGFIHVQLSEIVKILYIIIYTAFAMYLRDSIRKGMFFFASFIVLGPYLGLIFLQPDFGTACIFLSIFISMFFFAGGNPIIIGFLLPISGLSIIIPFTGFMLNYNAKQNGTSMWLGNLFYSVQSYGIFILVSASLLAIFAFLYYSLRKRVFLVISIIMFVFMMGFVGGTVIKMALKDYHFYRMMSVLNPDLDPEGRGYNINQSLIAIGSGKLFGEGLGKGSQNVGNFLPAKHTDFILALLAQEWGFVGVSLVILLNLLLVINIFQVAQEANDFSGYLLACGVGALFVAHFLINVMSVIGLFPVVGITLPFVSYGGSSIVSNFVALGVVSSIKQNRYIV